jgi:DNA processing protein
VNINLIGKRQDKAGLIFKNSNNYPSLLKEIQNPPSGIYVLGVLPENEKPRVALVGTRKATFQGRLVAKEIAKKLSERNIIIVSGLAMGIDTAAHEGVLASNNQTIAVLARGLDEIYPRQNENLARKIIETGGAIISEYPAGTPALPNQFLERNRIISGLSLAVVVVEAPKESGSLVTARLAAEQGREVFVVPGPINHPNYYGSHQLIRDGARLVGSVEDILEDLDFSTECGNNADMRNYESLIDDENQLLFLRTIQKSGQSLNVDKIIELTKLEAQVINQSIALLIVRGMIKETGRGYILSL